VAPARQDPPARTTVAAAVSLGAKPGQGVFSRASSRSRSHSRVGADLVDRFLDSKVLRVKRRMAVVRCQRCRT
jgi:hypothetical protein